MACSCGIQKSNAQSPLVQAAALPHEVKPGESCIFCAQKHMSVAYTELCTENDRAIVIGEMELARRHTQADYADISTAIAQCIYRALTESPDTSDVTHILTMIDAVAKDTDTDRHEGQSYSVPQEPAVSNPYVGALHLFAAYRLAFEVGYMVPNRYMIIGDLSLAREQLTRHDYSINTAVRELRHRVQTIKAADLDMYWINVCRGVLALLDRNRNDYDVFRASLASWLGIASILGV